MRYAWILAVACLLLAGCPKSGKRIPPTCVLYGTSITTPEGAVAIEELQVGARVVSRGSDGALREGTVSAVHHAESAEYLRLGIDGRELRVTAVHPLATPSGWVPAGELSEGDRVLTADGVRSLSSIERVAKRCQVVDLTVEPHANFFAAGVLVHNKSPMPPPEELARMAREKAERIARQQASLKAPATTEGEDGWSLYALPPELDEHTAMDLRPGGVSPAATVVHFFACRIARDEGFLDVIQPSAELDEALRYYLEARFRSAKLLGFKPRAETADKLWIRVELEFTIRDRVEERVAEVSVDKLHPRGTWRITALPTWPEPTRQPPESR